MTSDQISALARIPLALRERGTISIAALLREIGFDEGLSEEHLRDVFEANPAWVDAWITYSMDKRTTEGWFILEHGDGAEVGYLGKKGAGAPLTRYNRRAEACAVFVRNELGAISARLR